MLSINSEAACTVSQVEVAKMPAVGPYHFVGPGERDVTLWPVDANACQEDKADS